VLELSGDTDESSQPFVVKPGWQIRWRTQGPSFALRVTGDADMGTIVDKHASAAGVTSLPTGGTFQVEITAMGRWSIEVIDAIST
jgi:hypothetical protein